MSQHILGIGVLVETCLEGMLWVADVPALPGVTAAAPTEAQAIEDAKALAAAVLAGSVQPPLMALRDEAALAALPLTAFGPPEARSREAYEIADAMCVARRRR